MGRAAALGLAGLILLSLLLFPQDSPWVETRQGTLPLVLSAPHGGGEKPASMKDRTRGILKRDSGTREVLFGLAEAIELRTGRRPFLVASNLHRVKLDPNRDVEEAAQGDREAALAWAAYHGALEEAGRAAKALGGGRALILDIHGHGHEENWTELGHAVSAEILAKPDEELEDVGWIRGPTSLGAFFEHADLRAVPSPSIPHPDGKPYFTGGYITRRHRGDGLRSIQLELPSSLRKTENLPWSVPALADAVTPFLAEHFGIPPISLHPSPLPEEGPLAVFSNSFDRHVEVFGVQILATPGLDHGKLVHAAHVLAEWLDNDENGIVDEPVVVEILREGGAFLVMPARERDMRRLERHFETWEESGWRMGQDLYGEETLPEGAPHARGEDGKRVPGRFDASLEEVLHLVSHGWERGFSDTFGFERGSKLCDAMDLARGGRFDRIPRRYPKDAWYTYDDRTCDYECQAAEYFYWALTTLLGGQDFPGRAEDIGHEWRPTTAEALLETDPAVYELLSDLEFALPRILPDGHYRDG